MAGKKEKLEILVEIEEDIIAMVDIGIEGDLRIGGGHHLVVEHHRRNVVMMGARLEIHLSVILPTEPLALKKTIPKTF